MMTTATSTTRPTRTRTRALLVALLSLLLIAPGSIASGSEASPFVGVHRPVGTFPIGELAHLPGADVLIDQASGVCWWRSGTGSPSDCPVG